MIGSVKLPGEVIKTKDKYGFITETPTYIEHIPCVYADSNRQDVILANQSGYTADLIVEMIADYYSGQKILIDEVKNQSYDVKRTHIDKFGYKIQLTCQRR